MPKISISLAKAVLEEAGIRPEEAPAKVKELVLRLANLRGKLSEREGIINMLMKRIYQKLNELINESSKLMEEGKLNYVEYVRSGMPSKIVGLLENVEILLEHLKDVGADEQRIQYELMHVYSEMMREELEVITRAAIEPQSRAISEPTASVASVLVSRLITDVTFITYLTLAAGQALLANIAELKASADDLAESFREYVRRQQVASTKAGGPAVKPVL